jgi:hypothetical protein
MKPIHAALGLALLIAHGSLGRAQDPVTHPAPAPVAQLSPLVIQAVESPVPVRGGDGRYHLLYELSLQNFSGERVVVGQLQVLDRDGVALATFDPSQVAARLVVRDRTAAAGEFGPAQAGLLYLHVALDRPESIPRELTHRLAMTAHGMTVTPTAGAVTVRAPMTLVLDAPLRGARFIAGDGCCESTRHIRATLPLNGSAFTAQRFAIDWEQLDGQDRIYAGDVKNPESYVIYGKPAYAVADGRVVAAVDGLPNSPIGAMPNISVDQADGNHVILDLGDGHFALYAHFKPHSVRVHEGQYVRRGEVLGLVGTSGNSSEPHLHFQVTDGPSALLSSGLPYLLRQFSATRRGRSTAAFDSAISSGKPIQTEALAGAPLHQRELPLDLWITDLPP